MGIPILVRRYFYIETGPESKSPTSSFPFYVIHMLSVHYYTYLDGIQSAWHNFELQYMVVRFYYNGPLLVQCITSYIHIFEPSNLFNLHLGYCWHNLYKWHMKEKWKCSTIVVYWMNLRMYQQNAFSYESFMTSWRSAPYVQHNTSISRCALSLWGLQQQTWILK